VRGRRVVIGTAVVALCAWCGLVSADHRTTSAAEITWLATLTAVVLVDVALWRGTVGGHQGLRLTPASDPWPRPGRGGNGPALRGVSPWLTLVAVALVWDVLGTDTGPHRYHLTISALAQAYRPLNASLLLVWILVGVGYEAARVRRPMDGATATGPGNDRPSPSVGGALAAATGLPGSPHGASALLLPQRPFVGVVFWLALPVAAVLVEAAARRSEGRLATAEEFIRFISTAEAANVALIAAWAFAGFHLFAR
jgi:hypothetical protein